MSNYGFDTPTDDYSAEDGTEPDIMTAEPDRRYPCGTYEECIDTDLNDRNYLIWYTVRGIFSTWMLVVGGLLYSWYPSMIYNDSWWRAQCPQTPYITTTLSTINTASTGTTSLWEVAVNGWSRQECLNAPPMLQWTTTSSWILTTQGLGWLFWALNFVSDNQGGILNFVVILYNLVGQFFFSFVTAILVSWSYYSYGTQAQVLKSWSGSETYDSLGTTTSNSPDNYYLMWRTGSLAAGSTNSLKDKLLSYGNDGQAQISVWMSAISVAIEMILILVSWRSFMRHYQMERDFVKYDRKAIDENLIYDSTGCDQYGLDYDGVECGTDSGY